MVKIELHRAFCSKSFWTACILGFVMLVIGGWEYVEYYFTGYISQGTYLEKFLVSYGYGAASLIAVMFPVLAVVPYCMSYRKDMDSGFRVYLNIKGSVGKYRSAKLLAVSGSGFSALFIPCLLWLLICCFILKTGKTEFSIIHGIYFAEGLYTYAPFLYGMIYVCNAGLQGAVFSVLALGLSSVIKNKYLAAFLPFCYCIFTAAVLDTYNMALNALTLFTIGQYFNDTIGYWGILAYDAILAMLGCGLFLWGDNTEA